uniref:Uncharacterized protein n=1 Tax=Rhizophora mucronata TaxID=61149 RepID=A0A2P2QQR4_RHIMU
MYNFLFYRTVITVRCEKSMIEIDYKKL